jgi:thiol-disulfide isomerase/thioredoxin
MKRLIPLVIFLCFAAPVFSQADSIKAPYQRFTGFPPVKLLLPDSVTYFTKNDLPKKSPVMLMVFNPACHHCQHETEEIIKNIDEFKNIRIVMATSMPFDSMMAFRKNYKLDQYKNIIMGQDINYFLFTYYMISNLPFLAFYDKKKEFISKFDGGLPIERVIEIFKKQED